MLINEKKAEDMARAIVAWLDFQIFCKGKAWLTEATLSQPLMEFLVSLFSAERIEPQWTIPQLRTKTRGRPKQVDFMVKTPEKEYAAVAIEAKWLVRGLPQKQLLVDDILRLEMLRVEPPMTGRTIERLFLLAGLTEQMSKAHDDKVRSHGSHYNFFSLFLPWDDKPSDDWTTIRIPAPGETADERQQAIWPCFKSFADGYGGVLPRSYRTRLLVDHTGNHARVALWQVQSSRKRSLFAVSEEDTRASAATTTDEPE